MTAGGSSGCACPLGTALDGVIPCLRRHLPIRQAVVAYSGGPDSSALLYWLAPRRAELPFTLAAVHVNHGLHPAAADWELHCRQSCQGLGVPLQVLHPRVSPAEGGIEAAARRARYRALAELLAADQVVLTAHTEDDQAETVLLQLMRGAGPHGLAAMPECRRLGAGRLLRPLLQVSRAALRSDLSAGGTAWVEDPSNSDPALARAWVRQQLLPLLRQRWPGATRTLARSAEYCAEAVELLDALAASDLQTCGCDRTLALPPLLALPRSRARLLLRAWICQLGAPLPQAGRIERILDEVAAARADASPRVAWAGWEIRRYRQRLHLLPELAPMAASFEGVLPASGPLELPNGGAVRLRPAQAGEELALNPQRLPLARLRVTLRRPGDRLRAHRGGARRPLKDLLREQGLPPWWRQRLPVLRLDGRPLAVPGVAVEADFQAVPGGPALVFEWQWPGPSDTL